MINGSPHIECWFTGHPQRVLFFLIPEPILNIMMGYDEWLKANYEDMSIDLAESGAGYEPDFDYDAFYERQYEKYVDKYEKAMLNVMDKRSW